MSGLFNLMGQFGGMFNNWQTNQYNQRLNDWYRQQDQYEQDVDFWNQQNQYQRDRQMHDMWSSGASRGNPLQPLRRPDVIGPRPTEPIEFNFGGFGGMGGGMGGFQPTGFGGGGGGFSYTDFEGPSYQAPAAWEDPGIDTAGMVDPSAVIASAQPGIMEKMNDAFAQAGTRFGSSGMVGTPYADALGDASRAAATDIAHITNQYQFDAAQQAAELEQQRALAEYAANQNAWAQQGNWAHQGQLADMNQALSAWGQMGDWQYGADQAAQDRAMQQWMAGNDWRFQDYQMQQNQMMQLLPMMMQFMGGMF